MTNTDREHIIYRIACAVGAGERAFQRMVGAGWTESYEADWAVVNETYMLLLAEERPAVNLPARLIRNPSTTTRTP